MENVRPTVDRFEISDRSVILYVSKVKHLLSLCAWRKVNAIFYLPWWYLRRPFLFSLVCRYLAFVNFVQRLRWPECMTWEQSSQFQLEYMTIINLVSLISWLIITMTAHLCYLHIHNSPCFAFFFITADSCTEFYSPNPRSALLAGICDEGYCRCSQGILYKQKFNNHYLAFV